MKKDIKNLAKSVQQRLLNYAKKTKRPYMEILQYYTMERFLYRLSKSKYRDNFILKGALMLVVMEMPRARATRDIDLLAFADNSMDHLTNIFKEICKSDLKEDGMIFAEDSVEAERIIEEVDYKGVRVKFLAYLGRSRVHMQIDLGFGDKVYPGVKNINYPTILEMPHPKLKGYPQESIIAEKFQTMVELGYANSRMKDFYDIWQLSKQFDFRGKVLEKALIETFKNRSTEFVSEPECLSEKFSTYDDKNIQWKAFIRKAKLTNAPKSLKETIEGIRIFVNPIVNNIIDKINMNLEWYAPGPWINKGEREVE